MIALAVYCIIGLIVVHLLARNFPRDQARLRALQRDNDRLLRDLHQADRRAERYRH